MLKGYTLKIVLVFTLLSLQGCLKKVEPSPATNSPGYVKVDKKAVENTVQFIAVIVLIAGVLYYKLKIEPEDDNIGYGI